MTDSLIIGGPLRSVQHVYNHHRYDNGELDTITTAYRPRDEIKEWVRYSFDFITQYAANLGTIISFIQEGRYAFALGTALSTLWYGCLNG